MTDYLEEMAYELQIKLERRNHPRGGSREYDLIRDALEDVYKHAIANSKAVPREWARAQLSTMAVSSVRYALGRQTYITKATCQAIRWCIDELDKRDIKVMIRDIREAKDQMGMIGMACDHKEWVALLKFLEAYLPQSPNTSP